jgi:hypothetical protein
VSYTVQTNTATESRSATITSQGRTHTVRQEAAAPTCTYAVNPTTRSFTAAGGEDRFAVITQDGCAWTAASGMGWTTVSAGSGSGPGEVVYTVQANTVTAERSGSIVVNGAAHTVTQQAAEPPPPPPCTFTLTPPSRNFTASGGDGQFTVETQSHCQWSASGNPSWVALGSSTGTGTGTVSYSVQANGDQTARSGSISVNGQSHAITQDAAAAPPPPPPACTYSIDPTERDVGALGTIGVVRVSAGPTCAWTVTPGADWVRLSGNGTTGPGEVGYLVEPNLLGTPRTTTVTIAGQPFTVRQQ